MAHEVFISHSSQDKPLADAVCAALENAAIRCWIAPRDLQPGRSFAGEITRAIQRSKVMVLIFSAHSNASEQVLREVQLAANSHLHIVQFRIADVNPNDDLEYYLSAPHWLDALTPPLEDNLQRLGTSVKALLEMAAEEPAKGGMMPVAPLVDSGAERSQLDSVATAKDPTPPAKSTQTTRSQPPISPAASISAIAASKEPALWRRKRLIIVTAGGAAVLLLIAITALLTRPHPPVRKAALTSSKPGFRPTVAATPTSFNTASPEPGFKPAVAATPTSINTASQVAIFAYHRLVDKVRYPGTEITPAAFEAQMKELKDRGITVISMQDLLAWKRGEKNIPPRCAIITFDDGWKSQYEVAWPIMKRFGYPFTMFIFTEGVRGGSLGGSEAITWEQLAEMRDAGVDIEAHSATHQDLREGHNIMLTESGGKRTRTKLTGAEYEQWVQNEVVGSKQLLEQRLGIKVNCFAVPFGNYNEQVKELARNAGYQAMFTVYGQPITFISPLDSLGRYAIEANKPQVFTDAVSNIRVQ
jgi:peptidoglycan/xylan/chitin deacetylase (PgdA/CDA1 family)